MGSAEKKQRREINTFLYRFSVRHQDQKYPLRDHAAARDMIVEYASPLEKLFENVPTRYSIAIFAWNLSLAPEDKRQELLEEFLSPLVQDNKEGKSTFTDLILSLIERRETLYPDETLVIVPHDETKSAAE